MITVKTKREVLAGRTKEEPMTFSRRRFLQLSSLAGASFLVPEFLSSCASSIDANKKLVVIQLSGGNDGLNTVVPYRNDIYYRSRPNINLAKNELLHLTDEAGLHPSLKNLQRLYNNGYVSILNSVGYPESSRSHFTSMDVWHTADVSCSTGTGWLGRYMDRYCRHGSKLSPLGVEMDETVSLALRGNNKQGKPMSYLGDDREGQGRGYPDTQLGNHLSCIAEQINVSADAKLYYVSHGSFDTHVNQKEHQAHLLAELDTSLGIFVSELERRKQMKEVMILVFSEFGRRVAENPMKGTDHGAANNVFLISGGLKMPGMYNDLPDLVDLDDGDLKHQIDFRQVYATILDKWLDANANKVLGGSYQQLALI